MTTSDPTEACVPVVPEPPELVEAHETIAVGSDAHLPDHDAENDDDPLGPGPETALCW